MILDRLTEMQGCIGALERMKDDLVERGIALDGNSLGPIYRQLALHLLGESCKSSKGLTNLGSAIKIRSKTTGVSKSSSIVDDMDLNNDALTKVVVVVLDEHGSCLGIYVADKDTIRENGVLVKKTKFSVGLSKFVRYATKLF